MKVNGIKLALMIKCPNRTRKLKLTLQADNLGIIKWHVGAASAMHPNFKSHTGGIMTMVEEVSN